MQSIIVSNEILLERISQDDTEVIFKAVESNRKWLARWLPFVYYTNELKDTTKFIDSVVEKRDETGNEVYVIWYRGDFAGLIGFLNTDRVNEKTELGYWLAEKYTGKGIVTLSARKLIGFVFDKMMMNRITIKCAVGNILSEKVALRIGFKFEGIERQGERYDNDFFDLKVFSLLKDEWHEP